MQGFDLGYILRVETPEFDLRTAGQAKKIKVYLIQWYLPERPPLMSGLGGRLREVVAYGKFH